jgi:electron transfer flavoprotein beta subunit
MKILVGVKRVVDYAVKVRVTKGTVDLANVKQSMNPFCEIAVEEAVRIKESLTKLKKDSDIIAISIGPKQCSETIRTALAMGCDRGIHIQTEPNIRTDYMDIQPDTVAKIFANIIEKENPDLILVGKQSIDSDCGHVGTYLGGLLNIPSISYAAKINIDSTNNTAEVERETDTGTETVSITKLPAIITCDLRLNEPRYASLPNM